MNVRTILLLSSFAILLSACKMSQNEVSPVFASSAVMSGQNVIPVSVSCGYLNEPCVSVTVCNPTSGKCQVVDNILLDTGSYGLRVFSSQIQAIGLTSVTSGGNTLAECQFYLDNSADWGPVAMANVQLGNETTSRPVPIQIIDADFPGSQSAGCANPDDTPANSGYNGILGVGPHVADCGPACAPGSLVDGNYFTCTSGGQCSNTRVAESAQVSNPVAYLPQDNNGIAIILPSISSAGVAGANGYLLLGIGTSSNNTASNVTVIPTDQFGDFATTFEGKTYPGSFVDSGSNALFFPKTNTGLSTDSNGFYTTSKGLQPFTAQMSDGVHNYEVDFNVLSSDIAFSQYSPNLAFNDVAAELSGNFDWGLPFFFGRTVYVGIEGTSSNLGLGPYFAY